MSDSTKQHRKLDEAFFLMVARYQDGALSDEQMAELDQILQKDAEKRATFIEIQKRSALLIELERKSQVTGESIPISKGRRSLQPIMYWGMVAASLLLMVLWFGGRTQPSSRNVVARVSYQQDVRWGKGLMPQDGELLPGKLHLTQGIVRLDFDGGTAVTLEAPATYEIHSASHSQLHRGIAAVRKGKAAFLFATPAMDNIGAGEVFGVMVDDGGYTHVNVFKGSVSIKPPVGEPYVFREGEAVRLGQNEDRLLAVDYDASRFAHVWPAALGVRQTKGAVRFVNPGPPWDLTRHYDDDELVVFPETDVIELKDKLKIDVALDPADYVDGLFDIQKEATAGKLKKKRKVRSYLVQFNQFPKPDQSDVKRILRGTITFDRPIAGVIWKTESLKETDQYFGAEGAYYKTPNKRGLELKKSPDATSDMLTIIDNGHTLDVQIACGRGLDHVRVLVAAD